MKERFSYILKLHKKHTQNGSIDYKCSVPWLERAILLKPKDKLLFCYKNSIECYKYSLKRLR